MYCSYEYNLCNVYDTVLFCQDNQGSDGALSPDVTLLKQQFFTASGTNQRHEQAFQLRIQYAYRQNHPLLKFHPLKLAEWVAKNLADELSLPDTDDQWNPEDLNLILIHCIVSDRRGDNLHTFQSVECESSGALLSVHHGPALLLWQ
jgi:hypothetical protein